MLSRSSDGIEVSVTEEADAVVVTIRGEVDASVVQQVRDAFGTAVDAGRPRIVVDLGQVPFIDSSGLGALAGLRQRQVMTGGSVVLVINAAAVRRVMRVTGLDRVFDTFETRELAMAGAPG